MTDRNKLIEDNIGLAYRAANDMAARHGQEKMREDLTSAAIIGLIEAVDTWDPAKGKLSTHAWPRMRTAMNRWAQRHQAFRGVSLPQEWFENTEWREDNPVPQVRDIEVMTDNASSVVDSGKEEWVPPTNDGGIEELIATLDGYDDILEQVRPVIAALPPELRDALIAWWDCGSLTETARVLGLSSKEVAKNRIGKAMKLIRSALPEMVEGKQAVLTRADHRAERRSSVT